jgi:hypothetical protein
MSGDPVKSHTESSVVPVAPTGRMPSPQGSVVARHAFMSKGTDALIDPARVGPIARSHREPVARNRRDRDRDRSLPRSAGRDPSRERPRPRRRKSGQRRPALVVAIQLCGLCADEALARNVCAGQGEIGSGLENRCSGNQPWAGGSNPSPSARKCSGQAVAGSCFPSRRPAWRSASSNARSRKRSGPVGDEWHSCVRWCAPPAARSVRGGTGSIWTRGRWMPCACANHSAHG